MLKKIKSFIIILLIIVLCACGKEVEKPKEEVKEKPQKEIKEISIIDVNSKTRPYAIMINCHNDALPQSGIQNAYIVYELMVEGGITRMMALFKDVDVEKIGSIRSARAQYLDYVYENDAIYTHAGGSAEAMEIIGNKGINDINVDGQYGMRDKSLNRSWEHTLFTSTKLLKKGAEAEKMRMTTDKGNLLTYSPESIDFSIYKNVQEANNISIKYSDYRISNYKYDNEKKVYLRSMNNIANKDLVTGKQYEVKNIIVYGVNYSTYTHSGYSGYQRLDNIGNGEGYYISEGYAVPITWKKSSKNAKTIYKVKETGKDLVVNDGNTYIQIYPTSGYLKIK